MTKQALEELLSGVRNKNISIEEAVLQLKKEPFVDATGVAKIDTHRQLRQGTAEIIYGASKTPEQMVEILLAMQAMGQKSVLITRLKPESAESIKEQLLANEKWMAGRAQIDFRYDETSHLGIVGEMAKPDGLGKIVIATGGTSDIPVAEEAAITAEFLGNDVVRLYDVGVAGLHRLLSHLDEIMTAKVVIAIAGMEGALASVIGGLCDCPVIAVPTSVGYGASFEGLSALLSMLNSCASGVSVVNIDNGFGAAYQASMINHMK